MPSSSLRMEFIVRENVRERRINVRELINFASNCDVRRGEILSGDDEEVENY
jgi:hypothetical protein